MKKAFGLTVRGIIKNKDNKILILKRHPASRTDSCKWELPGGKVEPGEDFDKAIIREIKEETNLDCEIESFFEAVENETTHMRTVQLIMNLKDINGDVEISDEHVEWMWADTDDLKTLEISSTLKKILEKRNWLF